MQVKIQALSLELTADEIKSNIPDEVIKDIKTKDSNPIFSAYSVLQEGVSKPRVIGEGITPITWTRSIIEKCKNIFTKSVQFFKGHNTDNTTKDRKSLGEVVSSFQKVIGDKLHQIVIGYFPTKENDYDVCSIEADIEMTETDNGIIATAIDKITGIALGNSQYDKPAFTDAIRLGTIQAFEDNADNNQTSNTKTTNNKKSGDDMEIKFDDVQKAIRDMNIYPHQIYDEVTMKNDRVYGKMFDEMQKFTESETLTKKEIEERDNKIKELEKQLFKVTAKEKLVSHYPAGLTDKQKAFIEKRFNPETLNDDDEIKSFVESSVKEYGDYAKIFTDEKTKPDTDNSETDSTKTVDSVDELVNDIIKN